MTRKSRTEILALSDTKVLEDMVLTVEEKFEIKTLEEPNNGLVMVKMRESAQKHLFYLGEVFVTECKVLINGVVGLGLIRGAHPQKAYCMAVVDAAYNIKDINLISKLDEMLSDAKTQIDRERALKQAGILKTKVDFETVDEEVKA